MKRLMVFGTPALAGLILGYPLATPMVILLTFVVSFTLWMAPKYVGEASFSYFGALRLMMCWVMVLEFLVFMWGMHLFVTNQMTTLPDLSAHYFRQW